MEESAKRRERLQAMRAEASHAPVDNDSDHNSLSNPLIESSASLPGQADSFAPQRFDYYTDPLSAFSGNRSGSKAHHQISPNYSTPPTGQQNAGMTPPPARQAQNNYSSDQRIYQAPAYHNSSPYRDPTGIPNPFGMQLGTPPGVWNKSGGTSSNYFASNSPRGSSFPSPNFSPGQGRGPWSSNSFGPGSGRGSSPSFNSGPGRGNRFNNSPGSGRGRWASPGTGTNGGRGRGSHNNANAEQRPDLFFKKSMVDDPWKFMKPIVWNRENIPCLRSVNLVKSWISKPDNSKKAKVAETSSNQTSSQPSLAEYLAASFNEAVNDQTGT